MTLPRLNLEVAEAGYGITDGDAVLRSNVGSGPSRSRLDMFGAVAQASVGFEMDRDQYDYWRAFYGSVIGQGALPFLLDLVLDDSTLTTYEVKMTGPPRLGVKGLLQTVQFGIEVKPIPRDTASDLMLVEAVGLFGSDWRLEFDRLAKLVNEDLVVLA